MLETLGWFTLFRAEQNGCGGYARTSGLNSQHALDEVGMGAGKKKRVVGLLQLPSYTGGADRARTGDLRRDRPAF